MKTTLWLGIVLGISFPALLTSCDRGGDVVAYQRRIEGVMNTDAEVTVVAGRSQAGAAADTLVQIEALLRDIEKRMTAHLDVSEISLLNHAPVNQPVALSDDTMEVLRRARDFAPVTNGAFDVTCRPVLQLWRTAGQTSSLPTPDAIAHAVGNTGWRWFRLGDTGVMRLNAEASIDLGGIAKKHAIDRAVRVIMDRGFPGGLVNVGGDVRCFGERATGGPWRIGVRDPFSGDPSNLMAVLAVEEGSVCTSGNYERFVEIAGNRYSHIVDPRTGMPCDGAPSVTVFGPDAVSAGLWATALSVLGTEGIALIPSHPRIEVLMVVGDSSQGAAWYRTPGFDSLLLDRPRMAPSPLPRETDQ